MQKLIKSSGLTIKQFSEEYGIPYNSVRQWANGERQAPAYLKTLIEKLRNANTKGEQLNIENYTENINEEGIRKTINIFEYVIYFKGQNGAFIKVPTDFLIEQFKGITKKIKTGEI